MPLSVWRCMTQFEDGSSPLWINDAVFPFSFDVVVEPLEDGSDPLLRFGSSGAGVFVFNRIVTKFTTPNRVFEFKTDLNSLRGLQSHIRQNPGTQHASVILEDSGFGLKLQDFVFVWMSPASVDCGREPPVGVDG